MAGMKLGQRKRVFGPYDVSGERLLPAFDGISAHLAAVLQLCDPDEPALTDRVSEWLTVWGENRSLRGAHRDFRIVVTMPTQQQEAREHGADLIIEAGIILNDLRFTSALFQAKVVGPAAEFRRKATADWKQLRTQLRKMSGYLDRKKLDSQLAFLLAFVPASHLAKYMPLYPEFMTDILAVGVGHHSARPSRFGATAIAGKTLLDRYGDWKTNGPPYVDYDGYGYFSPNGKSLTRVVYEMLTRRRENGTLRNPPFHDGGEPGILIFPNFDGDIDGAYYRLEESARQLEISPEEIQTQSVTS